VSVGTIIGIPDRVVKPSVRPVIYKAEPYCRTYKESVEWTVYIISVIDVYESYMVVKKPSVIVKHPHSSNTVQAAIIIPDVNPANTVYPSVIVVKNGNVFYLDYSSVVIVLYKGVIIKS
jgi:hypothetical protein